jgi:AraC family L-rhamnose operon regulatory protein RhaS
MVNFEQTARRPRPTCFLADSEKFQADTCEPLKAAVSRNEVEFNALARSAYPGRHLPPKTLEGVMSIGYWDARSNQSWGLDWHRNEGIELTYVARGKVAFAVDLTEFPLSHGHLTITRPWQLHRVGDPSIAANRLHWIILDLKVRRPHQPWVWPKWIMLNDKDLEELTRILQHNEHPVWRADARIERCFESMAFAVDQSTSGLEESLLRVRINELFVEVLRLLRKQNLKLDESLSSRRRSVELFLGSLANHIDRPWTLDLMAEQCGLGRSRFSHYCHEITNMSPSEFLNFCRIERAREMMVSNTKASITEIAIECGFSSSQYFATVFRKHTRSSPLEFRNDLVGRSSR